MARSGAVAHGPRYTEGEQCFPLRRLYREDHVKQFYGFLSNGQTSALVSAEGSIDWLPFPRFDSPTVFCHILDDKVGGYCRLYPESHYHAHQAYIPETNILETRLRTPEGIAVIIDYLAIGRSELRRLVQSELPLVLECLPRFAYGQTMATYERTPQGALYRDPQGQEALLLFLRGPAPSRIDRDRWFLPPGEHEIVLRHTPDYPKERDELQQLDDDPQHMLQETVRYWRSVPKARYDGPFKAAYERSLLTMRGLTYRTNGAVLAAASTSLPEELGGARNWDYRFVWVRDAAYAAEAFVQAGDRVAARRLLEFLCNAVDLAGKPFGWPFLRIDGSVSLGERDLLWLSGHRGSNPVRVGNAASAQLQLDVEGDFLWAIWRYLQDSGDLEFARSYYWAIEHITNWTLANWQRADASLWEFRSEDRRYTHSQLLCWAALRAGALIAHRLAQHEAAERWRQGADEIARRIEERCYSPELGRYKQAEDSDLLDAALLCLPLYGFVAPDNPRWLQTLEAIERELVEDGLVYRYRRDNMGPARHPFALGSAWLARAYLVAGRRDEARRTLSQMISAATPLLLWGEHVDPSSGEQRGNFPQLFPHAGFVSAATELQRLEGGMPPVALWPNTEQTSNL